MSSRMKRFFHILMYAAAKRAFAVKRVSSSGNRLEAKSAQGGTTVSPQWELQDEVSCVMWCGVSPVEVATE